MAGIDLYLRWENVNFVVIMDTEKREALYLIPVGLSDAPLETVMPAGNREIIKRIRYFIVENVREARRFLRRYDREFPIDSCEFYELNTHTDRSIISSWLAPLRRGEAMGLLSDAGCPAVADPGSDIVGIAQSEGLRVHPLVGPSSILLSLMASGFNGQGFTFNGYIPVDDANRRSKLQELERTARHTGQTQIFIETPYRNNRMIKALSETLQGDTMVCVAADITDPQRESIVTLPAREWCKRLEKENYDKRPAIFLLHVRGREPFTGRKGAAKR